MKKKGIMIIGLYVANDHIVYLTYTDIAGCLDKALSGAAVMWQ